MLSQVIFSFIGIFTTYCEILCNGDFEGYEGTWVSGADFNGLIYTFYFQSADQFCWYNKNGTFIEIKYIQSMFTSKSVDLSHHSPYTLCQKIILEANRKYKIEYDCFNEVQSYVKIVAKIKGQVVSSLEINQSRQFGHSISYFWDQVGDINESELCFESASLPVFPSFGPMIDNITITKADHYFMEFSCEVLDDQSIIILKSDSQYNETLAKQIKNSYRCILQLDSSEINFSVSSSSDNFLVVTLFPQSSFLVADLNFQERMNSQKNEMIIINFTIMHEQQSYSNLTKEEKQLIGTLKSCSKNVSLLVQQVISLIRGAFCSYFIFILLGFWNVGLLYIFLLIPIVPEFTKSVYHEIFASLIDGGNIFAWISKQIQEQSVLKSLHQNIFSINQPILKSINNIRWFGDFGFSMDFITNNVDNYFSLLIMVGKLLLLRLFMFFVLKKIFKIVIQSRLSYLLIFAAEISSMTPQVLISATSSVLTSSRKYKEMINKIGQVLLVMCCLMFIFLHTVLHFKLKCKKKNQNLSSKAIQLSQNFISPGTILVQKPSKKTLNIKFWNYTLQSIDLLMLITTPLFVIFQNITSFLVINGIIIALKSYCFFKLFKRLSIGEKLFNFLMNLVWIAHHITFIWLYILTVISGERAIYEHPIMLKLLGISAIMTILIGGFIEMTKCIIEFVLFGYKIFQMCCKGPIEKENEILHSSQKKKHELKIETKISKDKPFSQFKQLHHNFSSPQEDQKKAKKSKNPKKQRNLQAKERIIVTVCDSNTIKIEKMKKNENDYPEQQINQGHMPADLEKQCNYQNPLYIPVQIIPSNKQKSLRRKKDKNKRNRSESNSIKAINFKQAPIKKNKKNKNQLSM